MYRKKGFTLIELLVVVSIIALLVAILMPALNIARMQAAGAVCLANQKSFMTAWLMFSDDHDDTMPESNIQTNGALDEMWVLPPFYDIDGNGKYTVGTDQWRTGPYGAADEPSTEDRLDGIRAGSLYKYIQTVEIYHCPGDRREREVNANYRSYGLPGGLNGEEKWSFNNQTAYTKISQVKFPAEHYAFIEEMDQPGRTWNIGSWSLWLDAETWNSNRGQLDSLALWHNDKGTMAYVDGHAEMHPWEDDDTMIYFDLESRDDYNSANDADGNADLIYLQRYYPISNQLRDNL